MNKQNFIKHIIHLYESGEPGIDELEVWQQRPYTAVRLVYPHKDEQYVGFGFSKVNWPDDWDHEEGIILCLRKASARIWKKIT